MSKSLVQKQFGDNAAAYATSRVHAKGDSLARLVELIRPFPYWRVLDVATAAGHTAFTFAPHVAWVVASDVTLPMLHVARGLMTERGIENVWLTTAAAEHLLASHSFHLVTCRIAPHHFDDLPRFMRAAARVLRPGGLLAVVDNVVPGSRLRGKKADVQRRAGDYVNAFERLRDPSHGRCLSIHEWHDAFREAGFALQHEETAVKRMEFEPWAERMKVSAANKTRLRAMLLQAPTAVRDFLTPQQAGDRISFQLTEGIFIGEKASVQ